MATTLITSHASLKTVVEDWLNRGDLTDAIGNFIQNAETKLRLDPRVRNLKRATFTVDENGEALASGVDIVESLSHDGPTYYGELDQVHASSLAAFKSAYTTPGVPRAYMVVDDTVYTAPEIGSGESFDLTLVYWEKLTDLLSGTNWLVEDYPSIYLYAVLVESAPYLKDDNRVGVWAQELEGLLERLNLRVEDQLFSGMSTTGTDLTIGGSG